MQVQKEAKSVRRTLSISEDLDQLVDRQVQAGVASSRTDWFEQAGWLLVQMQRLGLEDLDAEAATATGDGQVPQMALVVEGAEEEPDD